VQARSAAVTGVSLAALSVGAELSAANWDFNPRIEFGGTYNDNYRLAQSSANRTQVSGPLLDAQFGLRSLTPRSELSVVPRVHATYFPADHQDQSTDYFGDMKGEYRWQKSVAGGVAQYADETVISSELLPAGFPGVNLGQIVGGGSGRVSVRNRRKLWRLAPDLTYDFAPRRHLRLEADYMDVSYDQNAFQQFGYQQIGFRSLTGGAGMLFDVSPGSTFTVRAGGSRFEPDSGPNSTSYGLDTRWDLHRSQITEFYLRLGVVHTAARTGATPISNTGGVGGIGVSWTYEITEFVLDALRGMTPSSSGAVVTHDEVRFRVLRALRPRLSGFVGARGIRVRGAIEALGVQGTDYMAGTGGVEYQLSRSYRVAATYDYTWQRFQGEPSAASNAVALTIIYQPLSRYEPLPELSGVPTGRRR
jgi:hypothetical protein